MSKAHISLLEALCECPAGVREVCRRQMLPVFIGSSESTSHGSSIETDEVVLLQFKTELMSD